MTTGLVKSLQSIWPKLLSSTPPSPPGLFIKDPLTPKGLPPPLLWLGPADVFWGWLPRYYLRSHKQSWHHREHCNTSVSPKWKCSIISNVSAFINLKILSTDLFQSLLFICKYWWVGCQNNKLQRELCLAKTWKFYYVVCSQWCHTSM